MNEILCIVGVLTFLSGLAVYIMQERNRLLAQEEYECSMAEHNQQVTEIRERRRLRRHTTPVAQATPEEEVVPMPPPVWQPDMDMLREEQIYRLFNNSQFQVSILNTVPLPGTITMFVRHRTTGRIENLDIPVPADRLLTCQELLAIRNSVVATFR